MEKKFKVAILKETKTPPDKRVVITPNQCIEIKKKFPNVELFIQSSDIRAYSDKEYADLGFNVVDDINDCDIMIGVKEVDIPTLIPNKKYVFFSHTAKRQEYNLPLLKALLQKNITTIDHEYLTDTRGFRLVAFGHWAGVVGAYNGLRAFGKRNNLFNLKRAIDCLDLTEVYSELEKIKIPKIKILITGGGRVSGGAAGILNFLKIKKVSPKNFLNKDFDEAVYTKLDPHHYVKRKDSSEFELNHFFKKPKKYKSIFLPYTKKTDLFMACHFWNEKSPKFMTKNDMKADDFKISVIADISCDVAGPIPSTIRTSEIANPFYGYNPKLKKEGDAFDKNNITVMAVDNLPGELPREASIDFGKGFIDKIFPSLFGEDKEKIIERATITKNGKLGKYFTELEDFIQ